MLETILQMLKEPSSDSPLEEEVAEILTTKPDEFDKTARKWTKKHAK